MTACQALCQVWQPGNDLPQCPLPAGRSGCFRPAYSTKSGTAATRHNCMRWPAKRRRLLGNEPRGLSWFNRILSSGGKRQPITAPGRPRHVPGSFRLWLPTVQIRYAKMSQVCFRFSAGSKTTFPFSICSLPILATPVLFCRLRVPEIRLR